MSQNKPKNKHENIESNELSEDIQDNLYKVENKSKENKFKMFIKNKRDKFILSIIFAAIIGISSGFYSGISIGRNLPANHKYYTKSKVLATVGDVKITGSDFAKRMEPYFYLQGLNKLSTEEIESQEAITINYMANLEALYKAGKEEGITVTDDEVESNYLSTMSSIESSFNLTEDEFLKKFDLTEDYIKTSIEKEMIATTYLEDNSEVSENEAKNYYNNNKEEFFQISASHILISNYDENGNEISDEKKKENKELAEKLLKRALKGESFDDLALEYSDDSYTASSGGDLGYFSEGQMDDDFETAAFSLDVDEIYNEVVETNYGYHIIKKTGEQYSDFEDEKDSLIETLSSNKHSTLLQDALEKYDVKINM